MIPATSPSSGNLPRARLENTRLPSTATSKTPEALLVHMADNLDSKMAGMLEAIAAEGSDDEAWTPYSRILERHIYRRRLHTEDDNS